MTKRHASLRATIGATGLALLLLARAGSAEAAGPTPVAAFDATARIVQLSGPASLASVVACYQASARQPSFAHLAHYPDAAVIRLRFDGLVFETIRLAARADGGTDVTVALSAAYDRRDLARYTAARGTPLAACLAARPQMIAAATSAESAQ
jgi:hypothetical protein